MNPGISDVAEKSVEVFKGQPLTLALALMNIALLVFVFYFGERGASERAKNAELMFDVQKNIMAQQSGLADKLLHCITPEDAAKIFQGIRSGGG